MRAPVLISAVAGVTVALVTVGYVWWGEYYRLVTFEDVKHDRAILIDNIQSYVGVVDFLQQLRSRALSYDVDEPQATAPPKALRPPFRVTTVKVPEFSHLGYPGSLMVEFFNDRLVGVRFFPSDLDGYRRQLLSQKGLDLLTRSEMLSSRYARVWVATDHTGRTYVGWEDVRLEKELELWIRRYS